MRELHHTGAPDARDLGARQEGGAHRYDGTDQGYADGIPWSAGNRGQVWLAGGWHEVPIYRRGQLPPGATLAGPAIVEQLDTTIVVEPGDRVTVDALSNLIIEVGGP